MVDKTQFCFGKMTGGVDTCQEMFLIHNFNEITYYIHAIRLSHIIWPI